MAKVCASCGAPLEENDLFCMKCGTPVDQKKDDSKRYCPQCGNVLAPDAIFCDVCGRETEREKPKKKTESAEPMEPATMEGLVSPTITEDMFANAKELNNVKFDGFESVDESMLQKAEEDKALKHKEAASFEMDSAALPEMKKKAEPKEKKEAPQKREVTAETIKNSNPYGDFAAKAGGKTIQTAKDANAKPPQPEQQNAPQPAAEPQQKKSSGGLAGLIEKIKSIFTKK